VEDEAKRAIAASPLGAGLAALRGARAAAMEKGRVMHALLQHLPELPVAARRAAALRYVEGVVELAEQAGPIVEKVLAVLDDPALEALFGPESRAEIPLAGVIDDKEIGGLVDRLAVGGAEILVADYKTDRAPPEDSGGIPEKYLGQLAAYQAILAQIYPKRGIRCLLIWTETAQVMEVPPALLASHAPA
jgi:ATP-dependent helicase/nuclease subunit A